MLPEQMTLGMKSRQAGIEEGNEESEHVCMHLLKAVQELKEIFCHEKCARPFQLKMALLRVFSFLFPDRGLEEAAQG